MSRANNVKKIVAFVWAFTVLYLMIMRPPAEMSEWTIKGLDKLAHFGVFAIMSFLFAFAYNTTKWKSMGLKIAAFCALYGIFLESLQLIPITMRDFDILDIIANIIGAFTGSAFYIFLKNLKL